LQALEPNINKGSAGPTMAPKLIQMGEELAKSLSMERYYMKPSINGAGSGPPSVGSGARAALSLKNAGCSYDFDPRYLVFEFVWNIQLRKKQVEIVNDFRRTLSQNESKVKQMIMGAGKLDRTVLAFCE
jgi:hypothetical protein